MTRRQPSALPVVLALVLPLVAACRRPPPGVQPSEIGEPDADSVEAVLFLIGDAGEALPGQSPILARLTREVEAWSGGLGRDSAVSILFLGDNVYPVGIHDVGVPGHEQDTLRLRAQLDVLAGPNARRYETTGYFMAGNHDWGNMPGIAGLRRLRNQERKIEGARSAGLLVKLVPEAGSPGPHVVDIGERVRLAFMDTHWWLQARSRMPKEGVIQGVEEAIRGAGERHVVLAAHHPFASGGNHGGPLPIWEGLGIIWLLRQTGSLVQDLNSVVYRDLLFGLKEAFARSGRPLIFAAGHDHSLQVLEDVAPDEPFWNLVSGAGSKVTDVAFARGMLYGADVPGFMRVSFMTDGQVLLHVLATSDQFAMCEEGHVDVAKCLQDGADAFQTVFARRLN